MENKLEELLNMLIKKRWKPFNVDCDWTNVEVINRLNDNRYIPEHSEIIFQTDTHRHVFDCNIRDLVSKSSGLWQFCIANHLLKKYSDLGDDGEYIIGRWQDGKDCKTKDGEYIDDNRDSDIYHQDDSYQYRLIESALKNEDELEDFLLSNIKVGNED